jgi:ubiquinone/menaquinone biosynthesis C-methylase UbiE
LPIAEEQMQSWLKDIVDVIFAEKPENVLEIGCGTGLIYYQLAGKVKKYIGTDFSRSSINQIESWISKGLRDYGNTELHVCAAHEVRLNEEESIDTIIIKSGIQYFPARIT